MTTELFFWGQKTKKTKSEKIRDQPETLWDDYSMTVEHEKKWYDAKSEAVWKLKNKQTKNQ